MSLAQVFHFLLSNGIGQNFTASVLIGVPSLIWARIKVLPRLREHERKVHELHNDLVAQARRRTTGS